MKYILFIFLFSLSMLSASNTPQQATQNACPCCAEEYKQFDFWVGEWMVYDTTGKFVGENLIVKMEDNCVIQENWKSGSSKYIGTSYNFYDKNDQSWNQIWIDNQGANLKLKGKREGNSMIMRSELIPGQRVDFYYNQITWTLNEDGSVTQLWEIYDKDGNLLQQAFKGIYRKKESSSLTLSKVSIYNTTTRRAELLY